MLQNSSIVKTILTGGFLICSFPIASTTIVKANASVFNLGA